MGLSNGRTEEAAGDGEAEGGGGCARDGVHGRARGPEAEAPEGLVCPKCGAVLADTPENQAYVAAQGEDEAESEDVD